MVVVWPFAQGICRVGDGGGNPGAGHVCDCDTSGPVFRLSKSVYNPDLGTTKLVSFLGQFVGTFTLYSWGG